MSSIDGNSPNTPRTSANRNKRRADTSRDASGAPRTQSSGKSSHSTAVEGPGADNAVHTDHLEKPSTTPISKADDTFEGGKTSHVPGLKDAARAGAQHMRQNGGIKGAIMLKPLMALMSFGGMSFLRKLFDQVEAGQAPLSAWPTAKRMLAGAACGGVVAALASAFPAGIAGAVMAASGPGAIAILAAVAGIFAYGVICGAYQGYKSSRPLRGSHTRVTADAADPTGVQVKADAEPLQVSAKKLPALPSPVGFVSPPDDADDDADAGSNNAASSTVDPVTLGEQNAAREALRSDAEKAENRQNNDRQVADHLRAKKDR